MVRPRTAVLLATANLLLACHGAESLSPAVAEAAGTYKLATVGGADVVTTGDVGSLVLGADGTAAYRRTYAPVNAAPAGEQLFARGTFSVRGDSVAFAFVADPRHPQAVWHPWGVRQGATFTLHRVGPADGDVVEVYYRQ